MLYDSIDELQKDLEEWINYYNNHRTHQSKMCCGRTPIETLLDGKEIWSEKNLRSILIKHTTLKNGGLYDQV